MLAILLLGACSQEGGQATNAPLDRNADRAQNITIIRDDFGVPHIYARTDADAVFGLPASAGGQHPVVQELS